MNKLKNSFLKNIDKNDVKDYLLITLGIFIISIGISFFLVPNDFVVGGLSGFCLILAQSFDFLSYATINAILSLVLLIIGLLYFGFKVLTKTIYASILLLGMIFLWEVIIGRYLGADYNHIDDMPLICLYSATFIGLGVGLVLRSGGTTGGLDIPQKIMKELLHIPFSMSIYFFDGLVLISGIFLFGVEKGMYGLITMYLIGLIVDKVLTGFNNHTVTHIITTRGGVLANIIRRDLKRGVTVLNTINGYKADRRELLIVATNKREYGMLKRTINLADPNAFMFTSDASEVTGQGFVNENQ